MKKIELLAPAGDLDKLKLAYIYGADAVYIGGKSFSLRYFASNFNIEQIREGVLFAHNLNRKLYVAVNMIMHNEDLSGLDEYLQTLKDIEVDAIISSSLYVVKKAKEIKLEAHMSTQLSSLNSEAVNFYYNYGSTRIVLGREANIKEIETICKNTKAEIEVFIHGGMCSSYSGKCMLSQIMCDRDPNRGGCAHSCRWKYYPFDKNKDPLFENESEYLSMSSKDLCLINEVAELAKIGVASLKIEGRMKSYNYLAIVISLYRKAIDAYYEGKPFDISSYKYMLSLAENREFAQGFIKGNVTKDEMLLEINDRFAKPGEFIAIVRGYDKKDKIATIELKNKIRNFTNYLIISPNSNLKELKIGRIFFKNQEINEHTIAGDLLQIECDIELKPYDLIHLK